MIKTISLNQNTSFLRVYHKGKKTYHKYFVLYCLPNRLGVNRLGLKVGKKIAKATKRNRIRRLLKESYRLMEPELSCGYDIVIVARSESVLITHCSEVSDALRLMCARIGLLGSKE